MTRALQSVYNNLTVQDVHRERTAQDLNPGQSIIVLVTDYFNRLSPRPD